jgi:hypothetical protein
MREVQGHGGAKVLDLLAGGVHQRVNRRRLIRMVKFSALDETRRDIGLIRTTGNHGTLRTRQHAAGYNARVRLVQLREIQRFAYLSENGTR